MDPASKLQRLITAIASRDLWLVQQIASDPEVDINSHDDNHWTPLHYACTQRSIEVLKFLLGMKRIIVNPLDLEGWSPFLIACYFGFDELVAEFLKDPRTDVNQGDSESKTPLWYALNYGYLSTVKLLLASHRQVVNPPIDSLENNQEKIDSSNQSLLATSAENARNWVMQSVDQVRVENFQTATELFQAFKGNPQGVRWALRRQLELDGTLFFFFFFSSFNSDFSSLIEILFFLTSILSLSFLSPQSRTSSWRALFFGGLLFRWLPRPRQNE